MSFASLMNTTATVYRKVPTSDAYGTAAESQTARYSGMPCRIQAIGGAEALRYGSMRTDVSHKMYCPAAYSAIDHDDEVVDAAGTRYRVRFVRDPDQMGHHTEVEMGEIQGDIE